MADDIYPDEETLIEERVGELDDDEKLEDIDGLLGDLSRDEG